MLIGSGLSAQIEVEKTYKPSYSSVNDARDMIAATGGGYYITGVAEDANGNDAMFVMKVDDNLDSLWTKYYHNANFISQRGDVLLYNNAGNLCVIGITNGPGVHISLWELDLNGDTIQTRTFATGNNSIEFLIPDALVTDDDGFIVCVQEGVTSGSVHSFDSDWSLRWKKYGSQTGGWPSVDVNAQFVGVEMIDTVLYYAARKASGADNKSYFISSGISGSFLSVSQYGVNSQGIRAEDLIITDNDEALLVGMMTTQINSGLSGERTMILKTNLNGDSLGITNDLATSFPKNASIIDGNVVVDCVSLTNSSGTRMGIGVYTQSAGIVGKQDLETLPNEWDQSEGRVYRTVDAGGGKRVTLGVKGSSSNSEIILYKYTEDLVVGVEHIKSESNTFSIYPNPARSQLTISGLSGDEIVEVYNMLGARVYSAQARGKALSLDIASVERGVYFVHILDRQGRGMESLKVAVE